LEYETSIGAVLQRLRTRVHSVERGCCAPQRIAPAEVRCLLENWTTAEKQGVRFLSDRIMLDGVQFRVDSR
jgi:hypothetical protein